MKLLEVIDAAERQWHFASDSLERNGRDLAYAFFEPNPNAVEPEKCIAISSLHLDAAIRTVASLLDEDVKFTVRLLPADQAKELFAK